jgi:hypothetical protein
MSPELATCGGTTREYAATTLRAGAEAVEDTAGDGAAWAATAGKDEAARAVAAARTRRWRRDMASP